MKKQYIKPEMKVYEVDTPQLLAASESVSNVQLYGAPDDENDDMW